MREVVALLDEVYASQERVSRADIYRRALASDASPEVISVLGRLPEGEYSQEEVIEAINQITEPEELPTDGIPAVDLSDNDLIRELYSVHRTRHDTFRHGSDHALAHHDERTAELEGEYLRRFPRREVDPERLSDGARTRDPAVARSVQAVRNRGIHSGTEQEWDPEDLAIAQGRDPTPPNLERARRELAADPHGAIERAIHGPRPHN